jgi:hypothetical protein
MLDLAKLREGIRDVIAGAGIAELNAYGWPEPQPEYPCAQLGFADPITYHVSTGCEGVTCEFVLTLMVANADLEAATTNLEAILCSTLIEQLEDASNAAWSNLIVGEARTFRRLESIDGLACDLAVTVHV